MFFVEFFQILKNISILTSINADNIAMLDTP